jgi:hypothetical protein
VLHCGEKSGGLRIFCKFHAKIGVPYYSCQGDKALARGSTIEGIS